MFVLTLLIFLPLVGSFFVALSRSEKTSKMLGAIFSIATFLFSLFVLSKFDRTNGGFQLVEKVSWIPSLGTNYFLGIDGISLLLVLITTFLVPIALIGSWNSISTKVKSFVALMLLLEAGMIGVFLSLDLFLFYIFWEVILIPMYFIIGVWGGARKIYATIKFFLFTMSGSLLMLVAIIALGYYAGQITGHFTTDYTVISRIAPTLAPNIQMWMFAAFALAFCIKIPLFPLHTWLPDAHVEAPTAGSVILAGVLLKMGTYGLIRFNLFLFPQTAISAAPVLAVFAVISIIYGAMVAAVQPDMKKLIAYSSVSHLGFIVLGIVAATQESMQGAVVQMVNHGLSTGMLFLMIGMIYDQTHTREIRQYGGIAKIVPLFAAFFAIAMFSSVGLPALNGFVGEFLILMGATRSAVLNSWAYAITAGTGVILAAVYLLWMYQRVMLGPVENEKNFSLKDLNARELAIILPMVAWMLWIGLAPSSLLNISDAAVKQVVERVNNAREGKALRPITEVK